MLRRSILAALFIVSGHAAGADALPARDATRGELLYTTHCIYCHTTEVHWREKKLATDWAGLQAQVRRWQGNTGLGWSDEDIAEVVRYLNALHYHYPAPN
jgi:mono/diheme cytochrome c family protein